MVREAAALPGRIQGHSCLVSGLLVVLVAMACLNALLFAITTVNPLIASDGWYSVDVLIQKAAGGHFKIGDLFLKREVTDHSQPLRKLILLFHYRYFDLDFGVESVIAMMAAFLNIGLFWLVVRQTRLAGHEDGLLGLSLFVAMVAVYLSLNSSVVFSWSLVTLNFTSHTFLILMAFAFWFALNANRRWRLCMLFVSVLVTSLIADDTAFIAIIALCGSALLTGSRLRIPRSALTCTGVAMVGYVCYRALYLSMTTGTLAAGRGTLPLGSALSALLASLGDAWSWISIPLVSSVAHRSHLREWFGSQSGLVSTVIALLLVAAHAWFWWRAFRGRTNMASFLAVYIMLMFYGLLAGMLVFRVSALGSEYLWQPRYALIYQWSPIALLLMAVSHVGLSRDTHGTNVVKRTQQAGRICAGFSTLFLVLAQVPLSKSAWNSAPFIAAYQQRMAFQLGELAHNPADLPESCAPQLVVCRFDVGRRARLMEFLYQRRLNIFSPRFQALHRLYPHTEDMPRFSR